MRHLFVGTGGFQRQEATRVQRARKDVCSRLEFFRRAGVDAIYSNIPLGVQLEPAIPNPLP
jgi:hypothetical protein